MMDLVAAIQLSDPAKAKPNSHRGQPSLSVHFPRFSINPISQRGTPLSEIAQQKGHKE